MKHALSQAEIDALLASSGHRPSEGVQRGVSEGVAANYDFRRPNRVSKDLLRSLHLMHDRYALNVSTSLSAFLRSMTEVTVNSVEQSAYSDFLVSLPDPTAFYSIAMPPLDGLGALEINPGVAFAIVDRMLGGTGQTAAPDRALTEIEQNVLDSVVRLLLEHLNETWRTLAEVHFRTQERETRAQMLRVTSLNDGVIVLSFDLRVGDVTGLLNICLPAGATLTMEERLEEGLGRSRRERTEGEAERLLAALGRVPLPVTAMLQTRLSARELVALCPGDVVNLGFSAAKPVDVEVGQVLRFVGSLTTSGAGAAIRIDRVRGDCAAGVRA